MDQIKTKKSTWRYFRWVLVMVALILIGTWVMMTYVVHPKNSKDSDKKDSNSTSQYSAGDTKQMTEAQVNSANTAIAKGVSIDDGQNDWYHFPAGSVQGDGRPDNTSPYPLPYTDLKNVSFGADANYIYFKFTLWGALPTTLPSYMGDDVKFYCNNVSISKYVDMSGKTQVGMWQIGTSYIENLDKDKSTEASTNYRAITPIVGLSNMGGQTGTDQNSESIYAVQNSRGIVTGGPGHDYIIAGFPLDDLGLKLGDSIEMSISYEDASRIYHHQSVDLLLGKGSNKEGDTIGYVIGANTYQDLGFSMEAGKL